MFGENLDSLGYLINEMGLAGKIDLIYTDPPFGTNVNFTVTHGRTATISPENGGKTAYSDKIRGAEFIDYLKQRIVLLHSLLSDKGSLYLHTDCKIGHYVKVMMDEIFGMENFRNDITRIKCNPKNFSRLGYGNVKDVILFYTKSKNAIWHEPYSPYTESDINKLFSKIDDSGRHYTTVPLHAPGESLNPKKFKGILPPPGRHWRNDIQLMESWDNEGLIEWSNNGNPRKKIYLDNKRGKRMQDVWYDYKDPQYPRYPTEKNIDFIKLIIETSSNVNSIVLDPFCGSGTTLEAAEILGRAWIGIDKSPVAIQTVKDRLSWNSNSLFSNPFDYIEI